jgi:hypothetical protein
MVEKIRGERVSTTRRGKTDSISCSAVTQRMVTKRCVTKWSELQPVTQITEVSPGVFAPPPQPNSVGQPDA